MPTYVPLRITVSMRALLYALPKPQLPLAFSSRSTSFHLFIQFVAVRYVGLKGLGGPRRNVANMRGAKSAAQVESWLANPAMPTSQRRTARCQQKLGRYARVVGVRFNFKLVGSGWRDERPTRRAARRPGMQHNAVLNGRARAVPVVPGAALGGGRGGEEPRTARPAAEGRAREPAAHTFPASFV